MPLKFSLDQFRREYGAARLAECPICALPKHPNGKELAEALDILRSEGRRGAALRKFLMHNGIEDITYGRIDRHYETCANEKQSARRLQKR